MIKSRTKSVQAETLRRARSIVEQYRERLGAWQGEAAKLKAMKVTGRDVAEVAFLAPSLRTALLAAEKELEAQVEPLGPDIAQHGLVQDIRRALRQLYREADVL